MDAARGKLAQAEQREYKIKKELKKAVKVRIYIINNNDSIYKKKDDKMVH